MSGERRRDEAERVARFVLVRHGEAEGNRELRYLGRTDAPLTGKGERQAQLLAAALEPFRIAAIYSSPLRRAQATASVIGDALGLDMRTDERLREADYGAWENLTRDEARALDPRLHAAWESGAVVGPPEGDRLVAVRGRALAAVEELTARHAGEAVALVSHVGPIKALLCAALGLPTAGAMRMWLDPASISVVDWRLSRERGSSGLVRTLNSVAHLEQPVRWLGDVR
jgi:probable phosphoglycerate mutase